jgi:hypothetical protein
MKDNQFYFPAPLELKLPESVVASFDDIPHSSACVSIVDAMEFLHQIKAPATFG